MDAGVAKELKIRFLSYFAFFALLAVTDLTDYYLPNAGLGLNAEC
jgi:hypothetical protein